MKKLVLVLALAACSSPSKLDRNVAADTVLYAEPKAKCEAGFASESLHSARCELPNGMKVYCSASTSGWSCSALNAAAAGQPQAAAPTPPPAAPAPIPPPAAPPQKK